MQLRVSPRQDDADSPVGAAPTDGWRQHPARRPLEILPGLLVWLCISAPLWAAVLFPEALGFFLVLFSAYWLWKSGTFALGVAVGYVRLQRAQQRDWRSDAASFARFDALHHVAIIPTYGESNEILADTLHHLASQDFPLDRVAVVLAFEERDEHAPARAAALQARFGSVFGRFLVTFHPDLAGEVKGKSSNLAWAARRVEEEWVRTGTLHPGQLLVSVLDADSRLHPRYLSALSHDVLSHPDGLYHVFQPAILFYANHWRLPAPLRALNSVYCLFELSRMLMAHRLVTQSTYSLSWWAARRVGFWDTDIIPEDSHMFFKAFYGLGQRVRVRPIYLPVYADAAEGQGMRNTLLNNYEQIRRWAWGVSDVPYVVLGALKAKDIPFHLRWSRAWWYVQEHLLWPSHWFLLMLGGAIPPLLNPEYARSALGAWQYGLASAILGLTTPLLGVVIFVDWRLRPTHPDGEDVVDVLLGWLSFLLLPVVSFFLSTLPALDAHTRLLRGRYLEYRVTEKMAVHSRFRDEPPRHTAPVPPTGRPLRAPAFGFEKLLQQRPYALGGTTAMTDGVFHVYRDLR